MTKTAFICTVLVIVLAIYDLLAVQLWGIDYSVSRWFQNTGFDGPYLIFTLGYLSGHFWGYMPPKRFVYQIGVLRGNIILQYHVSSNDVPKEWKVRRILDLENDDKVIAMDKIDCKKV